MEQAEIYYREEHNMACSDKLYKLSKKDRRNIEIMESFAQQIREEEQDKAREVAIEFAEHCREVPYSNFTDDILAEIRKETEKEFDDFKKQGGSEQQKCVECGRPMQKKEIIIKGDEDTCDECLCPE